MTFLITVAKVPTEVGPVVQKIVQIQMLQITPAEVVHSGGEGDYLFTTENDAYINRLINDYEHVGVSTPSTGGTETLNLDFSDASDDPHVRKILPSNWEPKTRPALMRAATTTHFFNA